MPLPPALAAKLAKRGLITGKKVSIKDQKKEFKGASGCPNKYNIYHTCTYWCDTHWKGVATPDNKYMRNMQKLLARYPLPHNWTEVFDKGVGRYYYWDMETDMVSWLPPKHPKAHISEPAARLREKLHMTIAEMEQRENVAEANDDRERKRHDRRDRERESRDEKDRRHRYEDRDRGRRRHKKEHLDPMDPAAYSDIPQGTWSDGLEYNKSKADHTASGVLYQQRPYPAPGEVLASNKQKSKKH